MLKRPVSPADFFKRAPYVIFLLRELTSVANALYVVLLLVLLARLGEGREAYEAFLAFLWSPAMLAVHVVSLPLAVLHTVTWFNATGKAIVVRRGEERLPDVALAVPNYAAWAVVSILLAWAVLRG